MLPVLPFVGITNAQLHDTETADGNMMTAGSFDLKIQNEDSSPFSGKLFDIQKFETGKSIIKTIRVVDAGSVPFEYSPQFVFTGGEEDVCDSLDFHVRKDGIEYFTGELSDFNNATSSASLTGGEDVWELTLIDENTDNSLQGKYCDFKIEFLAYQDSTKLGFSDRETLDSSVRLAYEPAVTLGHNSTTHTFWFTLTNLDNFNSFTYNFTYDTDTISDGGNGLVILSNETQKTISKLLGTCSEGVCTYQFNPHNFDLTLSLVDIEGHIITVTKEL